MPSMLHKGCTLAMYELSRVKVVPDWGMWKGNEEGGRVDGRRRMTDGRAVLASCWNRWHAMA
jgi:hypothetical protein